MPFEHAHRTRECVCLARVENINAIIALKEEQSAEYYEEKKKKKTPEASTEKSTIRTKLLYVCSVGLMVGGSWGELCVEEIPKRNFKKGACELRLRCDLLGVIPTQSPVLARSMVYVHVFFVFPTPLMTGAATIEVVDRPDIVMMPVLTVSSDAVWFTSSNAGAYIRTGY